MNPASTAADDRKNILGITGCMLLVIASFSPWIWIRFDNSMLMATGSMLGLSGAMNNFALAASSGLALVLLLARHRWALIVPSLYGAIAFVWVVVAWLISAGPFMRNLRTGSSPVPAERLVPSPDLVLLALGAALGIIASWRDFFAAIRLVAARRAGNPQL